MVDSPEAAAIVRTTVALARDSGCAWWPRASRRPSSGPPWPELGCTAAQGYHFFKPMSADKIVAVLREKRQHGGRGWRAG